jgi:hypothetical protein
MKMISMLIAIWALLSADLAEAAGAAVSSLFGTAQVQAGSTAPRSLRLGDEVQQGDTVFTGPGSSIVLKFDDGQVVGLSANSRMQVNTYQYNPSARTGSILFSLVQGGMRAITGLIGRAQSDRVRYHAATATIGIRGTDVSIATDGGSVTVSVSDGAVTFTYGGETVTIPAGAGAYGADGKITTGAAQSIFNRLPRDLQEAVNGLNGLTDALNRAGPGIPRTNPPPPPAPEVTPGNNVPPGGAGGGTSSSR